MRARHRKSWPRTLQPRLMRLRRVRRFRESSMSTNFLSPTRQFDSAITEMMDRSQPVSRELETDLINLEKLNRFFGSYALVRFFLHRWLRPGKSIRLLDLCTGFGDIPRFIVDWCRLNRIQVEITAVDLQPATLELAKSPTAPFAFNSSIIIGSKNPADTTVASWLTLPMPIRRRGEERAISKHERIFRSSSKISLIRTVLTTAGTGKWYTFAPSFSAMMPA